MLFRERSRNTLPDGHSDISVGWGKTAAQRKPSEVSRWDSRFAGKPLSSVGFYGGGGIGPLREIAEFWLQKSLLWRVASNQ